jgi:hypothetical protein
MTTKKDIPAAEPHIELLRELVTYGLSTSLTQRARAAVAAFDAAPSDAKPVLRIKKNGPYIETEPTQEAFDLPSGEYELFTRPALPAWRPIATAPRDNTIILVRFGQDGVAQARHSGRTDVRTPWEFIDVQEGCLTVNYAVDGPGGPSHWMPMPGVEA